MTLLIHTVWNQTLFLKFAFYCFRENLSINKKSSVDDDAVFKPKKVGTYCRVLLFINLGYISQVHSKVKIWNEKLKKPINLSIYWQLSSDKLNQFNLFTLKLSAKNLVGNKSGWPSQSNLYVSLLKKVAI